MAADVARLARVGVLPTTPSARGPAAVRNVSLLVMPPGSKTGTFSPSSSAWVTIRASMVASPTTTSESGVASLILASCTRKSVSAKVNDSLATGVTPFSCSRSTTRSAIPSP